MKKKKLMGFTEEDIQRFAEEADILSEYEQVNDGELEEEDE